MKKHISFIAILSCLSLGCISANGPEKSIKLNLSHPTKSRSGSSGSDRILGIGVHTSILKLFSDNPTLKGFGINALYSSDGEKNAFYGDFSYYLPGKKSSSDYATAFSSATSPSQYDITVDSKIKGMGFRVGYRRYIINDIADEGFKMYFQFALGMLLFNGTSSTSTAVDPNLYYTSFEPTWTASGFTIGGGMGAEFCVNETVNIFAEGNLNVPANTANGEAIEVEIPASLQPVIGVRIHF